MRLKWTDYNGRIQKVRLDLDERGRVIGHMATEIGQGIMFIDEQFRPKPLTPRQVSTQYFDTKRDAVAYFKTKKYSSVWWKERK